MKKMIWFLTLALMNFWIPCASADIYQELDPMIPLEDEALEGDDVFLGPAATAQTGYASGKVGAEKKAKKAKASKKNQKKSSSKKSKNNKKSSH